MKFTWKCQLIFPHEGAKSGGDRKPSLLMIKKILFRFVILITIRMTKFKIFHFYMKVKPKNVETIINSASLSKSNTYVN